MKIKVSATLDQAILDWIDSQVKTQRFRNRSHAIDYALTQLINQGKTENIM